MTPRIVRAVPCPDWLLFGFAALLFAGGASAQAAAASSQLPAVSVYQAGGVSVSIPAPLKNMVEVRPANRAAMERLVPSFNRMITGFAPYKDQLRIAAGDNSAPLIAMVTVSRQSESKVVGREDFEQIVDSVAKSFNETVDSDAKNNQAEFDQRMKSLDLDHVKVTADKPLRLGNLFSHPNAAGFATLIEASGSGASPDMAASSKKLVSVLYMRVKSRVLFAYIFADYKDKDTILWLRNASEGWANEIFKANPE
jgi:hypothetical protein